MSQSNPTRPGRRIPWSWLLACGVLALGAYFWLSSDSSNTANRATGPRGMMMFGTKVPVRTVSVREGIIDRSLTAIGTVLPLNSVAVRSQVDGELVELLFEDGQHVKQGQLLAKIDPRSYQVQLDQAKAQLLQTQAQLKGAQSELQRHKTLFQQNSISRQSLELKETAVQQLNAQQKANQAEVARAQLQLDHTRISSPLSGRLGLRRLDKGNLIQAANTDGLVTITQISPISVEFSLPQTQLGQLTQAIKQHEQALPVILSNSQGQNLDETGQLLALDNQIDVATGSLRIKAQFANQQETLFPNQFVNVSVLLGREQGLLVPAYAVQRGSMGNFVYVINNESKVQVQAVSLGIVNSDDAQVLSGLELGQQIVVDGVDRLREGSEVEVLEHDGQPQEAKPVDDKAKRPAAGNRPQGRGPRAGH